MYQMMRHVTVMHMFGSCVYLRDTFFWFVITREMEAALVLFLSTNVGLRCFPIPVLLGTCFAEIKMIMELKVALLVAFSSFLVCTRRQKTIETANISCRLVKMNSYWKLYNDITLFDRTDQTFCLFRWIYLFEDMIVNKSAPTQDILGQIDIQYLMETILSDPHTLLCPLVVALCLHLEIYWNGTDMLSGYHFHPSLLCISWNITAMKSNLNR